MCLNALQWWAEARRREWEARRAGWLAGRRRRVLARRQGTWSLVAGSGGLVALTGPWPDLLTAGGWHHLAVTGGWHRLLLGAVVAAVGGVRARSAHRSLRALDSAPAARASGLPGGPTGVPPVAVWRGVAGPDLHRAESAVSALRLLVASLPDPVGVGQGRAALEAAEDGLVAVRADAARLTACEAALRAVGPVTGAPEAAALGRMHADLRAGVARLQELVAAAAEVVATAPTSLEAPLARLRLTEATDALRGLAAGQREMRERAAH